MNAYIADTHFGHTNIIRYCDRPFGSVIEMDRAMVEALLESEEAGKKIYHLGDLAWNVRHFLSECGWFRWPERHTLILGNHDKASRYLYEHMFGSVVGVRKVWEQNRLVVTDTYDGKPVKVLLSHAPQQDLCGCDYNLYGHHHNHVLLHPESFPAEEWGWLLDSAKHINASADVLGFKPRTLEELLS